MSCVDVYSGAAPGSLQPAHQIWVHMAQEQHRGPHSAVGGPPGRLNVRQWDIRDLTAA